MKIPAEKKNGMIGCVCAIICETLFGLSYLFTKQITEWASPLTLLSWRFIFAFLLICLCILTGIIKISFKGKPLLPLIWIALLQPTIYFFAETMGIRLTSASESGAIIACIPIVTLLASSLILKEKPTKFQTAGICVTLAGVIVCVLAKGMDASFHLTGYIMLFIAVISYSLYMALVRKAHAFTSAEITCVMLAFGAVSFTGMALFENIKSGTLTEYLTLPFTHSDFLTAVLYLSIGCSVLAFLLSNIAISRIGANRAASFIGIVTIVSILSGTVILGERFTLIQAIGAALIISGVYLANSAKTSFFSFLRR